MKQWICKVKNRLFSIAHPGDKNASYTVDMHCHPGLKVYLFETDIAKEHCPLPDGLPMGMLVDVHSMQAGNLRVALNHHYVPERGFLLLPGRENLGKFLKRAIGSVFNEFETVKNPTDVVEKTWRSINDTENNVKQASKHYTICVPKNYAEFLKAREQNQLILLHALEGGHHLGRGYDTVQPYIENLKKYAEAGICQLTLAHFFENDICDSAGGIPPKLSKLLGYKPHAPKFNGLSKAGIEVVKWCLTHGVIIDLVHSTPETREQVYEINKSMEKPRPIVFSHTGVRELFVHGVDAAKAPHDYALMPTDDEIKTIASFGGVLGVILMNYCLVGVEEDNFFKKDRGIEHVLRTIEHIHKVTGNFDAIALGTDLDGFSQVPDDINGARMLCNLREQISKRFGWEAMEKISHLNAERVLRLGWGNREENLRGVA